MKETIVSIEENGFKLQRENLWSDKPYFADFEGFVINTNKQTIKVGIESGQSCCENYGTLSTSDDLQDFVGAELKAIVRVDDLYNATEISKEQIEYLDEGGAVFINFETSKGIFQLTAYNGHNGYYGHEAVVVSNQLNIEETL